nr:YfhO family protein [Streptomyces zagrosensis]
MEPFRGIRARAAGLAALLAVVAVCCGDAIADSYPFGSRTRSVNDLGNQFVPFHAHLWDLLHGKADGGLLINWQSGYGSSFLPDLGTYVASPFAVLVAFFPRDQIDLAVYVITLLKIAAAAAMMAWLLRTLRPGTWWAAGALGASYALCGWTLGNASYNPMWLDGLIALPLLCLVGEWALARRRLVLGTLLVAVVWMANFYTAYMATIGAALILITRLLISETPDTAPRAAAAPNAAREPGHHDTQQPEAGTAREPAHPPVGDTARDAAVDGVRSGASAPPPQWPAARRLLELWRPLVTLLLGMGIAAPLVSVIYAGTGEAYPGLDAEFVAEPWQEVFARLLPGVYGFNSPAIYVDTIALLLALTLPFNSAVPRRVRWGWTGLTLAVLLSFQWKPTHLAWHAFSTPNGSQFRQTFVLCALLVIAAWLCVSYAKPTWRALLGGGAVLAAIALGTRNSGLRDWWAYPITLAGVTAVALAFALLHFAEARTRHRSLLTALAAVLLIGMQVGQSAATMAVSDRKRLNHMDDYGPWGDRQRTQREVIEAVDGWPAYRTEPGREQTVGNDPMSVGGQGAQYYSSLTSDVLSRTMTALGGGYTSRGRSLQSLDNPVTDVIFSVGARVHSAPDPHQRWNPRKGEPTRVVRQDVPPLVTVRPPGKTPAYGTSAYRNQELLLGSRVYTVPTRVSARREDGATPARDRSGGYQIVGGRHARVELAATCPAGNSAFLWAPHYWGTATMRGADHKPAGFRGEYPDKRRAAMQPLGRVPAHGQVRVTLSPERGGSVPQGALGCLDTGKLRATVDRLADRAATDVSVSGASVHAQLPPRTRGTAIVAMPRIEGWQCKAGNGAARAADSYLGLVSVPLDGKATSLECTFRPPGLRMGAAAGGGALLALISLAAWRTWRVRRASHPTQGPPAAAHGVGHG